MAFVYKECDDKSLKVKDPIYGDIFIPFPYSQIVLTKEMLRLEGINQVGFAPLEYKGAKNNERLSHSIGAFNIMNFFIMEIEELLKKFNISINEDEKQTALCAILLHDIGHGPFSHSLELITGYSHEQRTRDIILGDTEVNHTIKKFFGEGKAERIADLITVPIENISHRTCFTCLLKRLITSQLDSDRIDYLMRDSYHLGFLPTSNLRSIFESILDNMCIETNSHQEYELVFKEDGLKAIESLLLQRYRMYKKVYLGPTSTLGDYIFQRIIERYKNIPDLQSETVSESFRVLAANHQVSDLDDFLKMKDADFTHTFDIFTKSQDKIIAYLGDLRNIKDYVLINSSVSIEEIKLRLRIILGGIDLENVISIFSIYRFSALYKSEQGIKIKTENGIYDITECSEFIKPIPIENVHTFFNPELLRLELGMSTEDFGQYMPAIEQMIDELNSMPRGDNLARYPSFEDDDDPMQAGGNGRQYVKKYWPQPIST